jgi:hypothetical protein
MVSMIGGNPKELQEAIGRFMEENRAVRQAGGLRAEDESRIVSLIKKWAPYLGEEVQVEGKTYKMHPIPPKMWGTMALMFENQQLFNPMAKNAWEATTKSVLSLPDEYSLPIIREVFPSLIMNSICSVQPMPAQSGGVMNVYWLKFYRESDSPEVQVTTANSAYAYRAEAEVPKKMRMKVTSTSLTATKDILNAEWTTEAEEDARGTLGLDIPGEMLSATSMEILREIEQRVMMDILNGGTAGNVDWSDTVASGYLAKEWYETIFHAVIDASELIRTNRKRGANYIVAGRTALTYFMKACNFALGSAAVGPQNVGPLVSGVKFEGTVNGMWDLYSSDYITATKAIVSYYPESTLHAGYIWAPYIPLMPMPLTYAASSDYDDATLPGALVNNDSWNRNVRTRNGRYMCAPDMFATITIT